MNPMYSGSFMASWALGNRNACSRKPSDVHRSVESLTEFGVRRADDVDDKSDDSTTIARRLDHSSGLYSTLY
jgi:hypothetical protein